MKKGIKIVALILVYLFLCGKSCQDDQDIVTRQVKEAETLKEDIREEFSADYLSEESRYAAEMTAIQKVKDLADYVSIFSDISLDPAFRDKAGEMIRDIFVSEDVRLALGPNRNHKIKYLTVKKFLEKGFGEDVRSAEVIYEAVRIEQPLSRSGPEHYEGTLTGIQQITYYTSTDTITSEEVTATISIQALQKVKIFGKDTLNVWEVCLGDIRLNQ